MTAADGGSDGLRANGGVLFSDPGEDELAESFACKALAMKVPIIGGGVLRRGGRGPHQAPSFGDGRERRTPAGGEGGLRHRTTFGSTIFGSLHTSEQEVSSPRFTDDPISHGLLAGVGKPALDQNSSTSSVSERRGSVGDGVGDGRSASRCTSSSRDAKATWTET